MAKLFALGVSSSRKNRSLSSSVRFTLSPLLHWPSEVYSSAGHFICGVRVSLLKIMAYLRWFLCHSHAFQSCQQYVTELSSVSKEALEQAGTEIIVIGCGEWQPVREFVGMYPYSVLTSLTTHVLTVPPLFHNPEITDFRGPIYADPTRQLYRTLGMTIETFRVTPAGVEQKSYLHRNRLSNTLYSIWVRFVSMGFLG